jgi:MFS transporter, PPP family, 3-phenylpropionic acid transporter
LQYWLSFLPRNRAGKPMGDGDWKAVKELFANRDWQAFLAISLLSMVSTSVFYAFFPLYLNRVGVSDNWQGYFWVIAVLAEVAFMTWLTEPLIKRIGLKGVFLLGHCWASLKAHCLRFPSLLPYPTCPANASFFNFCCSSHGIGYLGECESA